MHGDAVVAQRLGDQLADPGLLGGHQPRRHLDQRDLAPEPGERLPQLAADRPAAEDDEPVGPLLGGQRVGAGPHRDVVDAFHGRYDGRAPGADHERAGPPQPDPVGTAQHDLELAGRGDGRRAAQQAGTGVDQPGRGVRVVPVLGGLVAPAYRLGPVQAGCRRDEQRLARDARDVGALAADPERLDDSDVHAVRGQRLGHLLTA